MSEPRVLVGPLYTPKLIGRFRHLPNILTFCHYEKDGTDLDVYDLVYNLFKITCFNDIFKQLPLDWEPDLVIWWDTVYQPLPPGVEDCPYPTAIIPGDWNLAYQTIFSLASAFDVVLTDKRLQSILQAQGIEHTLYWRCFSYDKESIYRSSAERIYDIGFIGNLNESIHPQRSLYLDLILQNFADKYQIHVSQGVWGDAYRRIFNQSKIIFNYTICQVLNMRAFEAPACGALLFIEAENHEVNEVFKDREDCILYTRDNLVSLLDYYLAHDSERERIAENGYQLVQKQSNEHIFGELLQRVPEILEKARTSPRQFRQLSIRQRTLLSWRQLACSGSLGLSLAQAKMHPEIERLVVNQLSKDDVQLLNTAVFLFFPVHCLERTEPTPGNRANLERITLWLKLAIQLQPENPLLYYHRALALECLGDIKGAMWDYSYCVELQARQKYANLFDMKLYILPFFREQSSHFIAVQWGRYSYEIENEGQLRLKYVKLLNSYIWSRLANLLERENKLDKALIAYQNALENYVNPYYYVKMAQIAMMQGNGERAWQYFQAGLKAQPFLIRYLSEWLTPRSLVEYWQRLIQKVRPYLVISQFELDFYYQLCSLCQSLQEADITTAHFLEKLAPLYTRHKLYQWLHPILDALLTPDLKPLARLIKPCEVLFKIPMETFPKFELNMGFVSGLSHQPEIVLGTDAPDNLAFQRVYHQPTDLNKRQIGPDLLPYFFPMVESQVLSSDSILTELWNEPGYYFLIVFRSMSRDQLVLAFEQIEQANQHRQVKDRIHLIMWSPNSTEKELVECAEMFSEEAVTQIFALTEILSPQEQVYLLQHSDLVLSGQRLPQLSFYIWWSLFLGTPIFYRGSLWNPYQNFGLELELSHHQGSYLSFEKEQIDVLKSSALGLQEKLMRFYHHRAYTLFIQAMWKLRTTLILEETRFM